MALPRDIVAGLARCLAERAGLEPPAWVIESRAQARMAACGLGAADYLALVAAGRGAAELAELIEAVRVGETRFFRHRAQIDALATVVAPALAARGRKPVRVWSAGCASGEEPYTLAMVLARHLPEHAISIVATDVSDDALAVAARAVYPRAALAHVPDAYRDAFVDHGADVRVRPEIARRVSFERQNLHDAEPPRGCAVVFCRNVLIYFAPAARRRAAQRLVAALEPGGHLFVGYSESLRDVAELDAVRAGETMVYVKRGAPVAAAAPVPVAVPVDRTPPPFVVPPPIAAPQEPFALSEGSRERARRRRADPDPAASFTLDSNTDPSRLTAELATALAAPGLRRLTIDLDGADFLADEIATVLRRARAAAATAGVDLELRATRPGPARWLRRHGLVEEPA
ncbi:MAG TPA: CheR family methyltransferase [Kofleriaceae bacterium]|nr:CheR family methyltransferase [Kofleriaceae bacterium]